MRSDISSFKQLEVEPLYDTSEKSKELLWRYPQQDIVDWMQIYIFYNGLNVATKQMLSTSPGGLLCNQSHATAQELVEDMATNGYQWRSGKTQPTKATYFIKWMHWLPCPCGDHKPIVRWTNTSTTTIVMPSPLILKW